MAVKTKYYFGDPDSFSIRDAELSNVIILMVTRSGTNYIPVTTSIANSLQCLYNASNGEITWLNAFPSFVDRPSRESLEKISVKFKF